MIDSWTRQREVISRIAADLPSAIRAERPPGYVLVAYAALAVTLLIMSVFAALFDRFPGDVWFMREIQALDVSGLRSAMRFATSVASPTNSIIALITAMTILLLLRQPRLAIFAAAVLSAHVLGAALKYLVDRGRPDPALVDVVRIEEKYSYPSGHVEWVVSFEGFVVFAVWQLVPNQFVRLAAVAAWIAHIALTSAGRIDQGLHWPSDVLASYMVGTLALLAVIWAYRVSLRVIPPEDDGVMNAAG